ncbi:DNA-binding transcriptional LysR family regulator [Variovorax sp. GrIS 2.14]|uniref:LysR substrate-binding domain-containing protein n=1 Tax=Variovorax sp. GrIS 2.14 TaxID=3071709 RepID=UPI0038F6C5D7
MMRMRQGVSGKFSVGSMMAASPVRLTGALLGLKALFPVLLIDVAVDTSDRLLAQLNKGVLELVGGRLTTKSGITCHFRAIEDEKRSVLVSVDNPQVHKQRVTFQEFFPFYVGSWRCFSR